VAAGTLILNGSLASPVVVAGGSFGGSGIVSNSVAVNSNGRLITGSSPGVLTVVSNLNLSGTVTLAVARNGAVLTNDQIVVVRTNTYGGTLMVTNIGASALQVGDAFQLFNAGVSVGIFANIVYPAGYTFTNTLATDGRIYVASAPVVVPPKLNYAAAGTALTFSWTGNFKLQWQTNNLNAGLGTNWFDYPGGSTNPVNVGVDSGKGSVFFRLIGN
jgi:hypothetical protein